MPKNKGRGGKGFRSHKKSNNDQTKRKLETKSDVISNEHINVDYAKVLKLLGSRRIKVKTTDNREVTCIIPGKFKKRVWINVGDIVMINIRDYQDDKSDVIHKYDAIEIRKLIKLDEISELFAGDINFEEENISSPFVFEDDDDEEEEDEENSDKNPNKNLQNYLDIDIDDL